jgi:uncharacterized protein YutE (UPF0331/DUF86 family)
MLPGKISKRVVSDRLAWVDRMLHEIRALPLESKTVFMQDSRNVWAAESCLRRALESLFDMGRHIAAKGFGEAATEYKEIAATLKRRDVISADELILMRKLAGYRNRLVHFYHDVSADELYEICAFHLGDVETVTNSLRSWLVRHADLLDETL